ncbi:hypothetical protein FQN54_007992 [Arachnomyces sp. PD_36]|nr:hypothetical protein FQN54_007992 [Arachnomyces sp. PD_36]
MSPTLRRIMKEAAELSSSSSSPSPYFYAQPESDSNLFSWHFTLAGPPAPTPYADGIYHGRIDLPPQYPLRPPSFRFLTPSGRFEVNREICLSISGHHEETWQPAWGIRTALIAIRSFMEGEAKGQVGGLDAKEETRREWARKSRKWRCDACGKTNEEVLGEWREVCREKGVRLDDDDAESGGSASQKDAVPDELRLGYRDELGKGSGKDGDGDNKEKEEGTTSQTIDTSDVSTSTPSQPSTETHPSLTSSSTHAASQSATQSSHIPTPTVSSSSSSPAPRLPTSTTQTTQTQNRPTTATQAATSNSTDSAWLDRAIFGLLLALVFMITRKIVLTEEDL